MLDARESARELGVGAIPPAIASLLSVLARTKPARTAVEIGTGAGISTVALLRGMSASGVLTTIDKDLDHLKAARQALKEMQLPANRLRPITGKALDVLPRLSKEAYDLVFIDADKANYPEYVVQARRLLRPGGLLIINDILDGGKLAQPTSRDTDTQTMRTVLKDLQNDDAMTVCVLPVGSSVLLASKDN